MWKKMEGTAGSLVRLVPSVHAVSQQWHTLCRDRRVHPEVAVEWWEKILQMYLEPHRAYHTVVHLQEMFGYYRQVEGLLERKTEVQFAIFFHDIVYDPKASDNEEKSALMFKSFAKIVAENSAASKPDKAKSEEEVDKEESSEKKAGNEKTKDGLETKNPCESLNASSIEFIDEMILQSKNHLACSGSACTDMHLFLDMDLSILGVPSERYAEYAGQVRREYQHVPDAQFIEGRGQFLKHLGERDRIYQSEIFHEQLHKTAKDNIAWELSFYVKGEFPE